MMTTTSDQATQAQWDTANRFLNQLLIDPTLANNYQQIIQQANGQEDAPEILTTWLQQQGYDTTPTLVYQALIVLQNTSLAYWTGVYGQSFFEGDQPAPVLSVGPNTEGNATPYLSGVELKKYVFQSVKVDDIARPTLSWNLDSNDTIGNVTFYYNSGITIDSNSSISYDLFSDYVGNWFEGTLQTSSSPSPQKYYGATEQTTDSSTDSQEASSGSNTGIFIAIGYLVGIVAISIIVGALVHRAVQEVNEETDKHERTHDEFLDAIAENANYQKTIRALNKDYFYNKNNDKSSLDDADGYWIDYFSENSKQRNNTKSQSETIDPQQPQKPTLKNQEQPQKKDTSSQEVVVPNNQQGQLLNDKTINNVDPESKKEPDSKSKDLEQHTKEKPGKPEEFK